MHFPVFSACRTFVLQDFVVTKPFAGYIGRKKRQERPGHKTMKSAQTAESLEIRLREAGLRPTRQRLALAELLYAKGDRHLSVEELHEEAGQAGFPISLATVYNTLHQFTEAGLLRVLAVEGNKTYFDTNTSDHHHFFVEGANQVLDIPLANITIDNLPDVPEGMEIANIDVIIRLRPKKS